MSSIQGNNSLWNIDFSNPTSVATVNQKEDENQVEASEDFSGRGLGFMSFVYASMDNTDDGTYEPNSSYVVENPDFLTKYSQEDIKNFLESNSNSFNTKVEWSEYEGILSDEQITHLKSEYSGDLTLTQFTELMDAIESLKELNDVTGEYKAEDVDSYQLFASAMAQALDSYATNNYSITNEMSDDVLNFLNTDFTSSTDTLSFADHFESMISDLTENTYMNVSGLLSVLDELRANESSYNFNDILTQLDNSTISGLIDFSSSI